MKKGLFFLWTVFLGSITWCFASTPDYFTVNISPISLTTGQKADVTVIAKHDDGSVVTDFVDDIWMGIYSYRNSQGEESNNVDVISMPGNDVGTYSFTASDKGIATFKQSLSLGDTGAFLFGATAASTSTSGFQAFVVNPLAINFTSPSIIRLDTGKVNLSTQQTFTSGWSFDVYNNNEKIQDNNIPTSGEHLTISLENLIEGKNTIYLGTTQSGLYRYTIPTIVIKDTTAPNIDASLSVSGTSLLPTITLNESGNCARSLTSGEQYSDMTSFAQTDTTYFSGKIEGTGGTNTIYLTCQDIVGNETTTSLTGEVFAFTSLSPGYEEFSLSPTVTFTWQTTGDYQLDNYTFVVSNDQNFAEKDSNIIGTTTTSQTLGNGIRYRYIIANLTNGEHIRSNTQKIFIGEIHGSHIPETFEVTSYAHDPDTYEYIPIHIKVLQDGDIMTGYEGTVSLTITGANTYHKDISTYTFHSSDKGEVFFLQPFYFTKGGDYTVTISDQRYPVISTDLSLRIQEKDGLHRQRPARVERSTYYTSLPAYADSSFDGTTKLVCDNDADIIVAGINKGNDALIDEGDKVQIKLKSSSYYDTTVFTTCTHNGNSYYFGLTTRSSNRKYDQKFLKNTITIPTRMYPKIQTLLLKMFTNYTKEGNDPKSLQTNFSHFLGQKITLSEQLIAHSNDSIIRNKETFHKSIYEMLKNITDHINIATTATYSNDYFSFTHPLGRSVYHQDNSWYIKNQHNDTILSVYKPPHTDNFNTYVDTIYKKLLADKDTTQSNGYIINNVQQIDHLPFGDYTGNAVITTYTKTGDTSYSTVRIYINPFLIKYFSTQYEQEKNAFALIKSKRVFSNQQ